MKVDYSKVSLKIYQIKKILKLSSFKLSSSNLRNYHHENILAFGDLLHKVHPLAGQGFNMTIRDLKTLLNIIKTPLIGGFFLPVLLNLQ